MGNRLQPVVGQWYSHRDKGDLFQVVATDDETGTIEIQEFDGALDEFDLSEWHQLAIEAAEQPEDWSGPVDDVEPDEFGYTDLNDEPAQVDLLDVAAMAQEELAEDEDFDQLPEPARPARAAIPGFLRRDH